MNILMVVPEMNPLAKSGGLADVAGALPPALVGMGENVSAIMPCYRGIEKKFKPRNTGVELSVPILDGDHWIDKNGEILETRLDNGIRVYLVKMDEYFDREALYSLPEGDYKDNCARFTFFCRAVIEFLKTGNPRPDVVHCHDWQAALVPIYLKTVFKDDPQLKGLPTVFTIHNLGYQGIFWHWDMKLIGVPWEYFNTAQLEYFGKLNLLKGALVFSDKITTVSKGYAREIQGPEYGYGLDGVIKDRAADLYGIVNGIDYGIWNPETDPHIGHNYTKARPGNKAKVKAALQKDLDLPVKPDVPMLGSISRLDDQKGFDLLAAVMDRLMQKDLQFVLLGTGHKKYHELFADFAKKYPDRTGITIAFDEPLAHRIEAGSDMFLMPSRYEPCGLNQLISLKYGTVPVVRATGGLDDTITQWDPDAKAGNGFKFEEYSDEALWKSINQALDAYSRPEEWKTLMKNGMKEDHSWGASAKEYQALYHTLADKTD